MAGEQGGVSLLAAVLRGAIHALLPARARKKYVPDADDWRSSDQDVFPKRTARRGVFGFFRSKKNALAVDVCEYEHESA